jgi:hypothetical protein
LSPAAVVAAALLVVVVVAAVVRCLQDSGGISNDLQQGA